MNMKQEARDPLIKLRAEIAARPPGSRILIDFDHTLFLANSTEQFLACARPASIAGLLLKALGALKVWSLFGERGYFVWRDLIRVALVTLLLPWTIFLFRRHSAELRERFLNRELLEILADVPSDDVVVLSFGFEFLIRRLLQGTALDSCTVFAASPTNIVSYRSMGKLQFMRHKGFEFRQERDIFISDSATDDADLLEFIERSHLIVWPNNDSSGAFNNIYLPFYYTSQIKRSPEFLFKQVLMEEYPIVLMAFALLSAPLHWSVFVSVAFLFTAYLLVYEVGYAENDRIGLDLELEPKLSEQFLRQPDYPLQPAAWLWALTLTLAGFAILDQSMHTMALERLHLQADGSFLLSCVALSTVWMLAIGLGRSMFYLFNHLPLIWRVYAYLPLHVSKYFSLLLFFPSNPAGYALLAAHLSRTSMMYVVRRAGGDIEYLSSQGMRLLFLLVFLPLFTAAMQAEAVWQSPVTWLVIAWCVVRAMPEVRRKLLGRNSRHVGMKRSAFLQVAVPEIKHVAITMATMNRPKGLRAIVQSFARLKLEDDIELRIVIIDNSEEASARKFVESLAADGFPWPVKYLHEPQRGISYARNRGLEDVLESGDDYIVFVDDDELVNEDWITRLCAAASETKAAAVMGKVVYEYGAPPPKWITRIQHIDSPQFDDLQNLDFGYTTNSLVAVSSVRALGMGFDRQFALTGGEDTLFFEQLLDGGYQIVYARNATSFEQLGPERLRLAWWAKRWYRQGNTEGLIGLMPNRHQKWFVISRGTSRFTVGLLGGLLTAPMMLWHSSITLRFFRMVCRGAGLLTAVTGHRYEEYRDISR